MDEKMPCRGDVVAQIKGINLSVGCLIALEVIDIYWILNCVSIDVIQYDSSNVKIDYGVQCRFL